MQIKDKVLDVPVIQGGMGVGVSLSSLAGAVAANGACGVISSLRKAVFDGDTMNGSLMAGQVAGQIDKIQPIEKIFEQIYEEYEAVRKELYAD